MILFLSIYVPNPVPSGPLHGNPDPRIIRRQEGIICLVLITLLMIYSSLRGVVDEMLAEGLFWLSI